MNVASPPGRPDEVFLSGSMNYDELQAFGGPGSSNGRSVVRSADAGVHVTDMTNDGKVHANGLHPDQHALVFVRTGQGKQVFFSASDGGIWRQQGPYVDRSSDCGARGLIGPERVDCEQYLSAIPSLNQSLNKGLQTLQFQSASVTPGDAGIIQGGTQDNGTWESDDPDGFVETVGGDGGQSGFNVRQPARSATTPTSTPQHDVNFDNGTTRRAGTGSPTRCSDSGEAASFYTPFTADPKVAGTVFDGLQHIWRTTDNGGDAGRTSTSTATRSAVTSTAPCGDWAPLGRQPDRRPRPARRHGATTWSRSSGRRATAARCGPARGSAACSSRPTPTPPTRPRSRSPRIDTKLRRRGRFVSPASRSTRTTRTTRSISYSGYTAYYADGRPRVRGDRQPGHRHRRRAKDLRGNLGDQPITDVVQVPSTGVAVRLDGLRRGHPGRGLGQLGGDARPAAGGGLRADARPVEPDAVRRHPRPQHLEAARRLRS